MPKKSTSQSDFDAYWHNALDIISTHGWVVQPVFPDEEKSTPGFVYTIGLAAKGLPELITFALPYEAAQHILNAIAQKALKGESTLVTGEVITEAANLPLRLEAISDQAKGFEFARGARRFATGKGIQTSILQVIWPDPQGKFPGEDGCEPQTVALQNFNVISLISSH